MTENGSTRVALERIALPPNVRALDEDHVAALARSIALRGLIVPLVVRPADEAGGLTLVAGFHRHAALRKLGRSEADVVVRDGDGEDEAAARAIENIARKQLDPYEEAQAVGAMLDRGLTEDGAADALGWPRRRVTQRAKLLALPDDVARGFGDGRIALTDLDTLLAVHGQAPGVALVLGRYLLAHAEGTAMRDPGWTLRCALREQDEVFCVSLGGFGLEDYVAAAGGLTRTKKDVREAIEETGALQGHRGWGARTPGALARVEFAEAQVDQARALGVLLELDDERRTARFVTDREALKALMEDAAPAFRDALRERAATAKAERAEQRKGERAAARAEPGGESPLDALEREHRATLRDLAAQARPANLALGDALRHDAAVADPADLDVARVFVYGLLGARSQFRDDGRVAQGYDLKRAGQLAVHGLRLCVEELQTTTASPRADGSPGQAKTVYATPGEAEAWLWRFLDGARTAGELYGRALCVLWAARYARQEVLAGSEQRDRLVERVLEERARTALERLGRRHRPVALRRLEKAIAAHAEDYRERKDALETAAARARNLAAGYRPEDLDERGWPTGAGRDARARRSAPAALPDPDGHGETAAAATGDGDG